MDTVITQIYLYIGAAHYDVKAFLTASSSSFDMLV